MNNLSSRMRTIETAKGFKENWESFKRFLMTNNFSCYEIDCILHAINSFYFMGKDIENSCQPERLNEKTSKEDVIV